MDTEDSNQSEELFWHAAAHRCRVMHSPSVASSWHLTSDRHPTPDAPGVFSPDSDNICDTGDKERETKEGFGQRLPAIHNYISACSFIHYHKHSQPHRIHTLLLIHTPLFILAVPFLGTGKKPMIQYRASHHGCVYNFVFYYYKY